ncbi:S-adenosyl-L-methionine-dependent methyltransferase [Chaetomium sp. MPI-SDFR-AT-0129]|nr:S-adenosyl-L-methionine-dependent methyltransferase [Chaetomium sp. MPI-SDFR-AT-0129]
MARGSNTITNPQHASQGPAVQKSYLQELSTKITDNISQLGHDDTAGIKAATAALELAALLRPPGDTIMGWFANMSVISAVRLFLHWGCFEAIPEGKGESISYAELSAKVNVDLQLLARIASMLTSAHILLHHPASTSSSQTSDASLSHTPTSALLRPGQPMCAMFSLMFNNVAAVSTILPDYFDIYGRAEPLGPAHIPTSYLAGHPEEDYFSLLKRDEVALRNFGVAMRMTSARVPVTTIDGLERVVEDVVRAHTESWISRGKDGAEEENMMWVDVGGGDGHTVRDFLVKFPSIKAEYCVVQDLDEVVASAEKAGERDLLLKGVKWVAMDFLQEAPVKGAFVYYLRHIFRDYSDPVATTILRNIARAMTNLAARVLISEQLHPDVMAPELGGQTTQTTEGRGHEKPPVPLYAAFKDFSMLAIGGKERSLEQFRGLAHMAGMRVSEVYQNWETRHAVVEMRLMDAGGLGVDG